MVVLLIIMQDFFKKVFCLPVICIKSKKCTLQILCSFKNGAPLLFISFVQMNAKNRNVYSKSSDSFYCEYLNFWTIIVKVNTHLRKFVLGFSILFIAQCHDVIIRKDIPNVTFIPFNITCIFTTHFLKEWKK